MSNIPSGQLNPERHLVIHYSYTPLLHHSMLFPITLLLPCSCTKSQYFKNVSWVQNGTREFKKSATHNYLLKNQEMFVLLSVRIYGISKLELN